MKTLSREQYADFFWSRVDSIRRQKCMRWSQIASRMGFSRNNVNKYRYTHIIPSVFIILQLAKALNVPLDELCDPDFKINQL